MNAEDHLDPIDRALYELMSTISEEAYCAVWMDDTEAAVWRLCRGDVDRWGQATADELSSLLAAVTTVSALSDRWIVWRDGPHGSGPYAVSRSAFEATL